MSSDGALLDVLEPLAGAELIFDDIALVAMPEDGGAPVAVPATAPEPKHVLEMQA